MEERKEYGAYTKDKENSFPRSARDLKSLSEIRYEMAERREKEMNNNNQKIYGNRHQIDHNSVEVGLKGLEQGVESKRKSSTNVAKQRTQNACATAYQHCSWDEEERGLSNWLRGRNSLKSTANTEATIPSASLRSVSAPLSVTGLIVPSFLQRDSAALLRKKQEEYAQALRQQMREKRKTIQRMNESTECQSTLQQSLKPPLGALPSSTRAMSTVGPTDTNQYNTEDIYRTGHHHHLNHQKQGSYAHHKDVHFQSVAPPPFPLQWSANPYLPCFFPYPYPTMPPSPHGFYSPSVDSHNAVLSCLNCTRTSRAQLNPSFIAGDEIESQQRVNDTKEVEALHLQEAMYKQEKKRFNLEDNHTSAKQQVWKHTEKLSEDRKQREKLIRIMEESEYNPWGRPGGGAPVRNQLGKVVTERGRINQSFDALSPRSVPSLSGEEMKKKLQEEHATDLLQQVTYLIYVCTPLDVVFCRVSRGTVVPLK